MISSRSRNEWWNLVETMLSPKWCDNRWLREPPPPTLVQKKSIKTCTKNLLKNKQPKLKIKSNRRRIRLAQVWSLRPRTRKCRVATNKRTRITTRSLVAALTKRNVMTTTPLTGEWATLPTLTITWKSRCTSRTTKAICFSASSRSRKNPLASMLPEERRRRVGKSSLPEMVETSRVLAPKSWTMPTRRSMISDTDSNVDYVYKMILGMKSLSTY